MHFSYAWQKAYEALTALTTDGSFDSRLSQAGFAVSMFPLKDVPPEIQRHVLVVDQAFTRHPGSRYSSGIAGILEILPAQRKQELSDKVVKIFQEVCTLMGNAECDPSLCKQYDEVELDGPDKWECLYWNIPSCSTGQERAVFADYAKQWLPNFPDEVLYEWLGRHGYHSMNRWGHLPLEKLRFTEEQWDMGQVRCIQTLDPAFTEVGPDSQGGYHLNRKGDWMGEYIRAHGTWPAPIVVLNNQKEHKGASGNSIPKGLVLIEGHSRLCRLLNLPAELQKDVKHRVWLAHLD